jgi:hypothetical protein
VNEHPEELLAAYVERSLGADERARVEAHLASCETCREEVALASSARETLTSLPQLEAPRGIPFAVRRRAGRAAGAPSRAWRLVGTAAAAAVLAAGAVFVFSQIDLGSEQQAQSGGAERPAPAADAPGAGGGGDEGQGLAKTESTAEDQEVAPQGALAAAPPPVLPIYAESDRDYVADDLAPLARRLRDDANAAVRAGLAPTARAFFSDFDPSAFTVEVRQAINCVLADVPPSQLVVPFRIEAASFQGAPAYVAAFLQGPTPDDEYDRMVMWVAHRETCGLISLASQVL